MIKALARIWVEETNKGWLWRIEPCVGHAQWVVEGTRYFKAWSNARTAAARTATDMSIVCIAVDVVWLSGRVRFWGSRSDGKWSYLDTIELGPGLCAATFGSEAYAERRRAAELEQRTTDV